MLEKAKVIQPALQVLMMTAYATVETAVDAMKIGAMDYLIKPFAPDALIPKVAAVYDAFQEAGYRKQTVGAIVLATGTTCFDPSVGKNPMGYGIVPNVVTSLEFERMLSGTGPDGGRLLRPSDKRPVKKAAWIQCVGSRDLQSGADFCSTVCCMFALKEAAVAKTVAGDDFQATIIYMDMRTFGKSFERYGQHTESTEGVRLERGRVHSIAPTPGSQDVAIRWTVRYRRNPRGALRSGGALHRPAGQRANGIPGRGVGRRYRQIRFREDRPLFRHPHRAGRRFCRGNPHRPHRYRRVGDPRLLGSRERLADDSPRRGRPGRKNDCSHNRSRCFPGAAPHPGGALPL